MSKDITYYEYEMEQYGRARKNLQIILDSPNVIDFEVMVLSKFANNEQRKQFSKTYDWYLRNGYDFSEVDDGEV